MNVFFLQVLWHHLTPKILASTSKWSSPFPLQSLSADFQSETWSLSFCEFKLLSGTSQSPSRTEFLKQAFHTFCVPSPASCLMLPNSPTKHRKPGPKLRLTFSINTQKIHSSLGFLHLSTSFPSLVAQGSLILNCSFFSSSLCRWK